MSTDINIYIGAVAVCKGVTDIVEDEVEETGRLMTADPMAGDALVEGAVVFVPNIDVEHALRLDGKDTETSVHPLPDAPSARAEFREVFAVELEILNRGCDSVEVRTGVYTWTS